MRIMVNHVARYIEIWDQIRVLPIKERPADLRREWEDLWCNKMTVADKVQVSKLLEARD
jgi:hypothetical protein